MKIIEFHAKLNETVWKNIELSDKKAASIFAFVALFGSAIAAKSPALLVQLKSKFIWKLLLYIDVFSLLICTLLISFFLLQNLSPQVDGSGSLNSFPDIAGKSKEKYLESVTALKEEDLWIEYAKHNFLLSEIAEKKYTSIRRAVYTLYCFVFSSVLFAIIRLSTIKCGYQVEHRNIINLI